MYAIQRNDTGEYLQGYAVNDCGNQRLVWGAKNPMDMDVDIAVNVVKQLLLQGGLETELIQWPPQ